MPFDMSADNLAILNSDEFGDVATIGVDSVPCIFDNEYFAVFTEGSNEKESTSPGMLGRTQDLVSVVRGVSIVVDAASYKAKGNPQPDGTGMSSIELEEISASGFTSGFSAGFR